jgi:hypothetical protein
MHYTRWCCFDIYRDLPKPVYAAMKVGLVPTSVPAKLITEMAIGDSWQIAMVNMSVRICQTGNHHMPKTNNCTRPLSAIYGSCRKIL